MQTVSQDKENSIKRDYCGVDIPVLFEGICDKIEAPETTYTHQEEIKTKTNESYQMDILNSLFPWKQYNNTAEFHEKHKHNIKIFNFQDEDQK